MGWKVIEGPKTFKATKTLAKQFAGMPHIKRDRLISSGRLEHHRKSLEEGKFRPPEWATALCDEDGVEYRVNGQHTSVMLAEAPAELLKDLKVSVTRYRCESMEDVAALWATFDSKKTMRSARDIYNTFAGTLAAFDKVGHTSINMVAAGMGLYKDPEKGKCGRLSPEDKGAMLLENPEFVIWADSILRHEEGTHLRRSPVTGAMYETWLKSQADAKKFWHLVASGEGANPSDPDRKLQKYLLSISIAMGGGARNTRTASQREVYSRCITAWNAWRKGEKTEMKYFSEAKVPKAA